MYEQCIMRKTPFHLRGVYIMGIVCVEVKGKNEGK